MIERQYLADCEGGYRISAAMQYGFILTRSSDGFLISFKPSELDSIIQAVAEIRAMMEKDQQHEI